MKEKEETGERKTITTQNPLNILKFPNEKQRNGQNTQGYPCGSVAV